MISLFRTAVLLTYALLLFATFAGTAHAGNEGSAAGPYRSPMCMAISPDGKTL